MNDLESKLLQIITERESALFEIERTLFTKRYNLSNKHLQIFAVQSISMIYSIWEGFIQRAFQIYLTEINNLNIQFHELSNDMIVHCMESNYKQFF